MVLDRSELFGCPVVLDRDVAREMRDGLTLLLDRQLGAIAAISPKRPPATAGADNSQREVRDRGHSRSDQLRGLQSDLELLRAWFDPVAKGDKVRAAVAAVPDTRVPLPFEHAPIVAELPGGARIVTPEGRVLLYCLDAALSRLVEAGSGRTVRLPSEEVERAIDELLEIYLRWTRRRFDDVIGLLKSETSTLRPAAAGLLFFLLLNRNTAPERALRRPRDERGLEVVSHAVHRVAGAYAATLTGRESSTRATDLYRGWALGELKRRLGAGLNSSFEDGIWLSPSAANDAIDRLRDDLQRRRGAAADGAKRAVKAAVDEYSRYRTALAGLGLAYERPASTRQLVDSLLFGINGEADGV